MGFPDHRLRKRHVRHMVAVPTIRIGAAEVHDHAAPAVHTGPARPRVGDAVDGTAIAFDQKVVIHAVHVVGEIVRPGTVGFRTHQVLSDQSVAAFPHGATREQSQGHLLCGRSPESELGAGLSNHGTQRPFQTKRNGSATLVFGCAKLSTSVIIALPSVSPSRSPTWTPDRSAASQ